MVTVGAVVEYLERLAPPRLAADWDNVGLLLGERGAAAERVMTCLTVTPESAAEAVEAQAQLVVTHHPILFRGAKRLTDATPEGRMLLELIAGRVIARDDRVERMSEAFHPEVSSGRTTADGDLLAAAVKHYQLGEFDDAQSLCQLLVRFALEARRLLTKDHVDVGGCLASSAENLFFLAELFRGPDVAFHRLEDGGAGIRRRQEFAHLDRVVCLGHIQQQLRMAFQIVITRRVGA